MAGADLVMDAGHEPSDAEILAYFSPPARRRWQALRAYIREQFGAAPIAAYSKCAAKPGWNIKYRKAGKAICTLYPEKDGFTALVVIPLSLVPDIAASAAEFAPEVREAVAAAKPFAGTKWLMLPVYSDTALESVKKLLWLKHR